LKKEIEAYAPNAIFVTGADALQAVQKTVKNLPVIFANVPRTEANRLNENIGGIYLELPLEAQFSYLKAVLPAATRIGVVYSKEISQSFIENAKDSAAAYGLELVARNVEDPEEMKSLLRQWKDIDVFWMFLDKTAMNSQQDSQWVINTMSKRGIPVFALHESFVREQGALFSVSSNFQALGKEAAELTQKVLAKPPAGPMPTRFPSSSKLAINLKTAKELNLQISASVISSTSLVYR
ncbi:MAG TPA: ABC transporter substrate binding protein, partial [Acidobacteriota bacterium]